MNWRNVKLIFWREVSDQLRDRRTLFMVVLLPLFLYPIMGVGMMEMTVTFSEQPRTVMVLNAKDLPEPQLIRDGHFIGRFFQSADDLERSGSDRRAGEGHRRSQRTGADVPQGSQRADAENPGTRRLIHETRLTSPKDDRAKYIELTKKSRRTPDRDQQLVREIPVQVLVVVPQGFKEQVEEINKALAAGERANTPRELPAHPMVLENSADEKSAIAFRRVRDVLSTWEDEVLKSRLQQAELPLSISSPVDPLTVDLARSEKLSANVWAKMFPALLVMMAVTGAFYPPSISAPAKKNAGRWRRS